MFEKLHKLQQEFGNSAGLLDLNALRRADQIREQKERRFEQIETFINKVPLRFRHKTWDDFKIDYEPQERCKTIAQNFTNTFATRVKEGTCLQFLGLPGTGKTLLALIIYQTLAEAGFRVLYEPSLQFLRLLQDQSFISNDAYQRQLYPYQNHQLLILDECSIGAGKDGNLSAWQRQHLYTIINQRYINQLCTVIISNHDQKELQNRLQAPIMGRVSETGVTIAFNWPSYRQQ